MSTLYVSWKKFSLLLHEASPLLRSVGTTRRADLRFAVHSNLIPIKMETAAATAESGEIHFRCRCLPLSLPFFPFPSFRCPPRFMERQCRVSAWPNKPQISDTANRELRRD